jgi:hypothetical protein
MTLVALAINYFIPYLLSFIPILYLIQVGALILFINHGPNVIHDEPMKDTCP